MNSTISDYSVTDWDSFFSQNDVVVPFLDVCVFAVKNLRALPSASSIYEFGCGMGNNLRFIRSLFKDVRILGSDISEVAIRKLNAANIPNSDFWVNGLDLKLEEKALDLVIERGAIQHVAKAQAREYVEQIYRAMKGGGAGYFEIASVSHDKYIKLGGDGHDEGYGFRTFYTLDDIKTLFEDYRITRIHHLVRELVLDEKIHPHGLTNGERSNSVQGSFQVEIVKS